MRKLIEEYLKNRYEIGKRKTFNLEGLEQYLFKKLGGETGYSAAGAYKKLYQIIKSLENGGSITVVKNSSILENIYSQSEDYRDTLKEIFRSNITITQKLPVLLTREADYHNIFS